MLIHVVDIVLAAQLGYLVGLVVVLRLRLMQRRRFVATNRRLWRVVYGLDEGSL